MKKKIFILIIIGFLYLGKSIAQNPPYFTDYLDCNSCLTIDNPNYFLINSCTNQSNYYNSNTFFMINPSSAVKTIRLNFIFVQKMMVQEILFKTVLNIIQLLMILLIQ